MKRRMLCLILAAMMTASVCVAGAEDIDESTTTESVVEDVVDAAESVETTEEIVEPIVEDVIEESDTEVPEEVQEEIVEQIVDAVEEEIITEEEIEDVAEDVVEEVTEETEPEEVEEIVEDVIDEEPEDTPDDAPVDIAEEPAEIEEQEPEDTPDASPDDVDDIIVAPAVLATVTTGYAGTKAWGAYNGNVYFEYDDATGTLRFYVGEQRGNGDGNYTIGDCNSSAWESLDIKKVIIDEGITRIKGLTFNRLSGDIVFELPKSLTTIDDFAFGTWVNSWIGKDPLHAIVNYKGTEDDWNNITIGSDNDGLSLTSTWYFQVYIPDEINLSNTNPEEEFVTYRASSTCSVKAGVYFGELFGSNTYDYDEETMTSYADIGTCSEEQNIVTGLGNTVYFFAEHQCHINDDGTQYGTCTVGVKQTEDGVYMYEPDYQDYTASQKLTFEFVID